jgi:hypothetical protein
MGTCCYTYKNDYIPVRYAETRDGVILYAPDIMNMINTRHCKRRAIARAVGVRICIVDLVDIIMEYLYGIPYTAQIQVGVSMLQVPRLNHCIPGGEHVIITIQGCDNTSNFMRVYPDKVLGGALVVSCMNGMFLYCNTPTRAWHVIPSELTTYIDCVVFAISKNQIF